MLTLSLLSLFLGFSSYAHSQNLIDLEAQKEALEMARDLPSDAEMNEQMINSSLLLREQNSRGYGTFKSAGNCKFTRLPDPPVPNVVTLTFDDGPAGPTGEVLDVLRNHGIKATFFMLGSNAAANPGLLQRVHNEGHLVANHSTNHPSFWSLNAAETQRQIDVADRILSPYMAGRKFFRYPYGNSSCTGNSYLQAKGYQAPVAWHVDSCDWAYANGSLSSGQRKACGASSNEMSTHVLQGIGRTRGGIVLFHDIHRKTAQSLDLIIRSLKAQGYRFTNLNDASTYPNLNR